MSHDLVKPVRGSIFRRIRASLLEARNLAMLVFMTVGLLGSAVTHAAPGQWRAQWITAPGGSAHDAGVFHFRRDVVLKSRPTAFVIRISADNRYRLNVNGVEVASGPARGDTLNWRYETVDVAAFLRPGTNTFAATVWNFGDLRPAAQTSIRTAFLLQGEGPGTELVDTGGAWKVLVDRAYSFSPVNYPDSGGFYVAGPGETLDAKAYPWDWQTRSLDDEAWQPVVNLGNAADKGATPFGMSSDWQMVPRTIPPLERRKDRFQAVRRSLGVSVPATFLAGRHDLIVPARSTATLLLDRGQLTMGYPILRATGGAGATATLTYAEALFDAQDRKGNRNDVASKTIRGLRDVIQFDGGPDRTFRPLWLRAYRYVQVDVTTGDQPLRLQELASEFVAYPFEQKATFDSDIPWIKPIWDLDWHALRLSAFETFWDTPYYEQLQYVGDTRIESLLSVYQSGDDRLMRNAIEQIDASRTPDGLTLSSYPSWRPQRIPSFSLWWVAMVHDYWMVRDDPAFVRRFLPGIRATIDWYEQHVDATGMVGPTPWWSFLDWSERFKDGTPPGAASGHSTAFSLQFAIVLRQAAEIETTLGRPANAEHYRRLADRLVAAATARAWDPARGLFADAPEEKLFSQQTNTLAILADAVPADGGRVVMEKILTDTSLVQASFYFRFYVDEALGKVGLADRYVERLQPWRDMLANGMTSTAETPEPTRSDSHAWSAHPNYHLLATVTGIRPASPGFRSVVVAPVLGNFKRVTARMPHPSGVIEVRLLRKGFGGLTGQILLPDDVEGQFRWGGKAIALRGGWNSIDCQTSCRIRPSGSLMLP